MGRFIYIFMLVCSFHSLFGQEIITKKGVITFKAAQNIYIRFDETDLIQTGDSIYLKSNAETPCLVVTRKSSSSVVCYAIGDCHFNTRDTVFLFYKKLEEINKEIEAPGLTKEVEENPQEAEVLDEEEIFVPISAYNYHEEIRGRISAATQSNFTNVENQDRHRMMLRLSVNADYIQNSRLSFQTYLNYRKNYISENLDYNRATSFYNVYNLAFTYHLDPLSTVTLGRKINQKISSLGPIDGLQIEKYFGRIYLGSILGFKPDIADFGFNADLLQYGGYIGYASSKKDIYSLTTIGLLEQRNNGNIDRRYAYLQHSSSISGSINIFTSAELDIYENIDGQPSGKLRLSNIYSSLRIKPHKKISITLSYDARKRIILYETFRTEIERLLADDEARQGIRLRINFNPVKNINGGISFSKRYQNDSANKSNNINGYISHSRLPGLGGRMVLSFNQNKSNYAESAILSLRFSRTLIKNSVEGEFYYRFADYNYVNSESKSKQQFYGSGFSFRISKQLVLSILGEYATRNSQNNLRLNTRIIKRFYR